jgi:hypothetical protein
LLFLPFLRLAIIVNNASGPTTAPMGFHGTYGLGLFGFALRVRNLPVDGS